MYLICKANISIKLTLTILFSPEEIPQFEPARVWLLLSRLKTNKATVPGDFPAKLSKFFAAYLAEPLADIIIVQI